MRLIAFAFTPTDNGGMKRKLRENLFKLIAISCEPREKVNWSSLLRNNIRIETKSDDNKKKERERGEKIDFFLRVLSAVVCRWSTK